MKVISLVALFIMAFGWSSAQSKYAHMNSQEVLAAMPEYKSAVAALESYKAEAYGELQLMGEEFELALAKFQELIPTRSPMLNQFEQDKLKKKEEALMEREQSIQQELDAYSRELNQPILAKFQLAVQNVATREKYDYVFDISMLMVHNGPDITQLVITEVLKLKTDSAPPPQEIIKTN